MGVFTGTVNDVFPILLDFSLPYPVVSRAI